jgi:hypothetical protein
MSPVSFTMSVRTDALFKRVMEQARKDVVFGREVGKMMLAGTLLQTQLKGGVLIIHLSDLALGALYKSHGL